MTRIGSAPTLMSDTPSNSRRSKNKGVKIGKKIVSNVLMRNGQPYLQYPTLRMARKNERPTIATKIPIFDAVGFRKFLITFVGDVGVGPTVSWTRTMRVAATLIPVSLFHKILLLDLLINALLRILGRLLCFARNFLEFGVRHLAQFCCAFFQIFFGVIIRVV